jgi:hypothetical protein
MISRLECERFRMVRSSLPPAVHPFTDVIPAVMNYTEMEAKVREATNNEPWVRISGEPAN